MRFIQESGYSIKPAKAVAFQQWIIANEDRMAKSYPPGTSLIGVFIAVFSSEKSAGELRVLEQLDSYGALDRLAALAKEPDSEYSRLWNEMFTFLKFEAADGWSSLLLKDVVDATVFNLTVDETPAREPVNA
jgi:hypothetical protein